MWSHLKVHEMVNELLKMDQESDIELQVEYESRDTVCWATSKDITFHVISGEVQIEGNMKV